MGGAELVFDADPCGHPQAFEVRFNRAWALLELGRHEEAERALLPFVAGRHENYRRGQAAALLHEMRQTSR